MTLFRYLCTFIFCGGIIYAADQRTSTNFIPILLTSQSDVTTLGYVDVDVFFLSDGEEGVKETFYNQPLIYIAGQYLILIPAKTISEQMRVEVRENEFNLEQVRLIIERKECLSKGLNSVEVAIAMKSIFNSVGLSESETIYLTEMLVYNGEIELTSNTGGESLLAPPFCRTPAPSTTLSGSRVTFEFDANGNTVERYWFGLGTSRDVWDLFYSAVESNVSQVQIEGIPTNGQTIFGILSYKINGIWTGVRYEWTAASPSGPWQVGAGNISYSGGKVGIGTANPTSDLEVTGEVKASSLKVNGQSVLVSEQDPTVIASVKDGVSWQEVSGAPSSMPPSGPAGGALRGNYPNPYLDPNDAVTSINDLTGQVELVDGGGLKFQKVGQYIWISISNHEAESSWAFNISDLSEIMVGSGGLGLYYQSGTSTPVPVYWFNDNFNTFVSGSTSMPHYKQVSGSTIWMELLWVTTRDGGSVNWYLDFSARDPGGVTNRDGVVTLNTLVDKTGNNRIYKSIFALDGAAQDELLLFSLGRQADTNAGNVGILGIRFVYITE